MWGIHYQVPGTQQLVGVRVGREHGCYWCRQHELRLVSDPEPIIVLRSDDKMLIPKTHADVFIYVWSAVLLIGFFYYIPGINRSLRCIVPAA